MSQLNINAQQQIKSKDEMMKNLQGILYVILKSILDYIYLYIHEFIKNLYNFNFRSIINVEK